MFSYVSTPNLLSQYIPHFHWVHSLCTHIPFTPHSSWVTYPILGNKFQSKNINLTNKPLPSCSHHDCILSLHTTRKRMGVGVWDVTSIYATAYTNQPISFIVSIPFRPSALRPLVEPSPPARPLILASQSEDTLYVL